MQCVQSVKFSPMSIMKAYRVVDEKLRSHGDKCIVSRPGRFFISGDRASDAHGMVG